MPLTTRRRIAIIALWILLFCEHLLFGATEDRVALLAAIAHCLLGAALLVWVPCGARLAKLRWIGALFFFAILLAIVSTVPGWSGAPHEHWQLIPGAKGVVSLDPLATRLAIVRWIGYAALMLAGVIVADKELAAVTIITPLMIGTAYALWAIAAFHADPTLVLGVRRPPLGERLSASFLSPNTAGTLLAMLSAIALCRLYVIWKKAETRQSLMRARTIEACIIIAAAAVAILALTLTGSRGAVLALVTAMLFVGVALVQQWADGKWALKVAGICFLALVMMAFAPRLAFGWTDWSASFAEREVIFHAFVGLIERRPWLGYGMGTFEWQVNLASTPENAIALSWIGAVHNFYIQTIAEQGMLGGGALLLAIGWAVGQIVLALLRKRSMALLAPLLAALLVAFFHGLSDYALQIPSMMAMTMFMMGIAFGASISERRSAARVEA